MSEFLLLFLLMFPFLGGGVTSNPSCPKLKAGMTNVHLVCHTHDDVGWLKTVDQYYYGAKKKVTWVGVQYILDSIVPALLRDANRKFIYVESAFFFRWWQEQTEQTKDIVKGLVVGGQLEFVNGGWCMNDEAAAHYDAVIDQMTLGLAKLNATFGPAGVPRIAWQIDPFGHSREQASLFAQMGMDGLFFGRLDYDDKKARWRTNTLEMVWKGSSYLGKDSWLFTGVLPNGYSPPRGFCFDLLCPDDPIMDDPNLEDYNKDEMVDKFLQAVEEQKAGYYATSNLIMTMGEDFNFVYAEAWYKNLDKLIRYVNERQANGSNVNVVYSTPSCYLDAVHDSNRTWPTKSDDFFPYASDPHAFWTGYFTSRPTLKGYIRQANNILQAVKQLSSLGGLGRGPWIDSLGEAMAIAQHHDAVTGTAKQHVTDDYVKRLAKGIQDTQSALNSGMNYLTQSRNSLPDLHDYHFCPLLNISWCPPVENTNSFVVNVYNPLSRPSTHYVRIPIVLPLRYMVADQRGNKLTTQIVPLPAPVLKVPGRNSSAKYELVFLAEDLPALGAEQYIVVSSGRKVKRQEIENLMLYSLQDKTIVKGKLSVTIDNHSNKLKYIGVATDTGVKKIKISQDWLWYEGHVGNNTESGLRASGAYIFRPEGMPKRFGPNIKLTAFYDGPLVGEFHQEWSPWVTQVLRVYKDKNFVEVEWLVGPIPAEDGVGKEVISRFYFEEMESNGTFYTDANGREMQKRIKDHRPTWPLNSTEPASQNYYPATSRMLLEATNGKGQAALLTDRAQGCTSLSDGVMEVMVHRRLFHDDAFGVGEALNETAFGTGLVARGRHLLIHSTMSTENCDFGCLHRSTGEGMLLQPIITFSRPSSLNELPKDEPKKSSLAFPLPPNIRLLTLEPWDQGWLLRLENYYEANESALSGTSYVDIKNLFTQWKIEDIKEVTLGANMLKEESRRLKWQTVDEATTGSSDVTTKLSDVTDDVTKESDKGFFFSPMQIRSFIVKVSKVF